MIDKSRWKSLGWSAQRAYSVFARAVLAAELFMQDVDSVKALMSWPKFSVSSYFMVSRLLR
jgi:hypothetical protein